MTERVRVVCDCGEAWGVPASFAGPMGPADSLAVAFCPGCATVPAPTTSHAMPAPLATKSVSEKGTSR